MSARRVIMAVAILLTLAIGSLGVLMDIESWLSLLPLVLILLVAALVWVKVRHNALNAPPVTTTLDSVPILNYKGPLAFFRRHYNGDYSLGRSYWVNTFLVSLFAPVLGLLLLPWLSENFPARYGSLGFLFITALGIVAWFWAVSGTWKSASKHVQRGGKPVWAAAAKFMIVIGVLKTFGDVVNLTPALEEHIRIAMGAQPGPSTKLEVRADGRSILLSGGINDGSAEQLEKALQLAPAVTTVVLSSDGGWIREGKMLADVIRMRDLNTYVENYCASACTIAFLAGRERAAAPSAKIGFHASRSVGSLASKPSLEETAEFRSIYLSANLPDDFIRKAIETPHDKMWYPSHSDLLAAGVLTRESMGGETATMSTVVRSKDSLVEGFKKVDMYTALAERSPQDFDRIIDAAWDELQRGGTDAEVTVAAQAQLTAILPRFMPFASDEILIAHQALMQEQLEALREISVGACVEMAFPSGQSMSVISSLPPELIRRESALMTKMLREADAARGIEPSQEDIDRVIQQAVAQMTHGQLIIFSDEVVRRRSSPLLTCNAAITFFSGINAIPASERGHAIRILYTEN